MGKLEQRGDPVIPRAKNGPPASMPAFHAGGAIFRPFARSTAERRRHDEGDGSGAVVLVRIPLLQDNYAYLVVSGPEATVVDPGEAGPVSGFVRERGLSLARIFVTHHHADHAGGCSALKRETACAVYGPRDDRMQALDRLVGDGETVQCAGFDLTAVHTPGHTRSHMAYAVRAGGSSFLFSGDCLFPSGCGRVLEGAYREMLSSLRKIASPARAGGIGLSGETVLLAGHEYTLENLAFAAALEPDNGEVRKRAERFRARLGETGTPPASLLSEERATNPFLRPGDPLLRKAIGMERAGDVEVFAEIRGRKDRFGSFTE
jgi:hydroxyacylglutathione hydrolase